MKRFLCAALALALALSGTAAAFAAGGDKIVYSYETRSVTEQLTLDGGITARVTVPNYFGSFDMALTTFQGTVDSEVHVIYIPDSKWDGNSCYSAVTMTLRSGKSRLFSGSTPIVCWKELYSYGLMPVEGGSAVFSGSSLAMNFLEGPGLYTAQATIPYSAEDLGTDDYAAAAASHADRLSYTAAGYNFVFLLNDTAIENVLSTGKLDPSSQTEWPELAGYLRAHRTETLVEPTAEEKLARFTLQRRYTPGMFLDMPRSSSHWYDGAVRSAYELGFMQGSGTDFLPENSISVAECVTIAARMHDIYNGGSGTFQQGAVWYSTYVNYASANGIIKAGEFTDLSRPATRAEMAYILANSVSPDAIPAVKNTVLIPDVTTGTPHWEQILALYKAGVLTGYSDGSFEPYSTITRAETAAIISRIADPSQRAAAK